MTDHLPALIAAGRASSAGAIEGPLHIKRGNFGCDLMDADGDPIAEHMTRAWATHFAAHPPATTRALWDAVEALAALHADNLDYIRLNKLSGAENNHVMRLAEAALARLRALAEAGR